MGCNNEQTPTMRELLEEQLVWLRGMRYWDAKPDEEFDLAEWIACGANFEEIDFADTNQGEACAFAWGYLRGAHEMADLTLDQLISEYDLSYHEPAKPRRRARTRRAS